MDKLNFQTKKAGDTLAASEWNQTVSKIDELVEASNNGGGNGGVVSIIDDTVSDPSAGVNIATGVTNVGTVKIMELTKKKKGVNTTLVSQNNINIEPRESVDDTKGGNISFKPGDDIEFCSHHRLAGNQDEVSIKVIDGDDNPVKLQLNAAEMTLTTKDKTGDNANVFDINVNSGKNTKGYLKVRAQAIDLRCEAHGGIALQPKGEDSDHHMNKIKFEHGGGDGLEFGTFNTEKTSIFTEEYRFNKNGVIKLANREIIPSDKADQNDPTTTYKYNKQGDDFYDVLGNATPSCTWNDIVSFIAWAKENNFGLWEDKSIENLRQSFIDKIQNNHGELNVNFDPSLNLHSLHITDDTSSDPEYVFTSCIGLCGYVSNFADTIRQNVPDITTIRDITYDDYVNYKNRAGWEIQIAKAANVNDYIPTYVVPDPNSDFTYYAIVPGAITWQNNPLIVAVPINFTVTTSGPQYLYSSICQTNGYPIKIVEVKTRKYIIHT